MHDINKTIKWKITKTSKLFIQIIYLKKFVKIHFWIFKFGFAYKSVHWLSKPMSPFHYASLITFAIKVFRTKFSYKIGCTLKLQTHLIK